MKLETSNFPRLAALLLLCCTLAAGAPLQVFPTADATFPLIGQGRTTLQVDTFVAGTNGQIRRHLHWLKSRHYRIVKFHLSAVGPDGTRFLWLTHTVPLQRISDLKSQI